MMGKSQRLGCWNQFWKEDQEFAIPAMVPTNNPQSVGVCLRSVEVGLAQITSLYWYPYISLSSYIVKDGTLERCFEKGKNMLFTM